MVQHLHALLALGTERAVWERVFKALSDDPDFEYVLIDATYIRVHQHGTGAKGGNLKIRPSASRAAACSTTKIAALVDALGNLVRFVLLPGPASRHHQL